MFKIWGTLPTAAGGSDGYLGGSGAINYDPLPMASGGAGGPSGPSAAARGLAAMPPKPSEDVLLEYEADDELGDSEEPRPSPKLPTTARVRGDASKYDSK